MRNALASHRAWRRLRVFTSSSDWLTALFLVIGHKTALFYTFLDKQLTHKLSHILREYYLNLPFCYQLDNGSKI